MSNEQIYLYRRKGLSDYATCDRARYVELSQHKLFETMICYASADTDEVERLREALEKAQADLARMTEGRDGLRSTLDEANKIIAWQRTELDELKKQAGHSALRREAFDKLAKAVKLSGAPSGDVYACDSEDPTNKESAQ